MKKTVKIYREEGWGWGGGCCAMCQSLSVPGLFMYVSTRVHCLCLAIGAAIRGT